MIFKKINCQKLNYFFKKMKTFFKKYNYTFVKKLNEIIILIAEYISTSITAESIKSDILLLDDVWDAINEESVNLENDILIIQIIIKIGPRSIIEYFKQPLVKQTTEVRLLNVLEWRNIEPICFSTPQYNVPLREIEYINKINIPLCSYIRINYDFNYPISITMNSTFNISYKIICGKKYKIIYHKSSGEVWMPYDGQIAVEYFTGGKYKPYEKKTSCVAIFRFWIDAIL